jgi:hypothetical protein
VTAEPCGACGAAGRTVLVCPGCGASSEIVSTSIAHRVTRDGAQARTCTACEQVTMVVEPDMVCPACENLRPEVNDLLRTRFDRIGPADLAAAPCVGCGYRVDEPNDALTLSVPCHACAAEFAIPLDMFAIGQGMRLRCGTCGADTSVPNTVWCPVCGQHLRRDGIAELIAGAN